MPGDYFGTSGKILSGNAIDLSWQNWGRKKQSRRHENVRTHRRNYDDESSTQRRDQRLTIARIGPAAWIQLKRFFAGPQVNRNILDQNRIRLQRRPLIEIGLI
jgi:hypothetical protein